MTTEAQSSPQPFHATINAGSLDKAISNALIALREPDRNTQYTLTLSFSSDTITIRGQTPNYGVEHRVPATVSSPRADLVVSSDNFSRAVRACGGVVEFTEDDGQIHVKDETGFSIAIPTIEIPDEKKLPTWPERTKIQHAGTVPRDVNLGHLLKRIATHASKDPARFNLHGIAFEHSGVDGLGYLVATDGHRMAILRLDFDFPATAVTVLPPPIAQLVEDDKALAITVTASHVFFGAESTTAWAKISKTMFPPWRSVLPYYFVIGSNEAKVKHPYLTVSRSEIARAAKQFAAISTKGSHVTLQASDNTLKLHGAVGFHQDHLEGSCELKVDGTTGGDAPVTINPTFFREAVDLIEDPIVRLQWVGPLDPVTISARKGRDVVVVMPVRS